MIRNSIQQCPRCHNQIPVDAGYPVWCDRCEWNLLAFARGRPKTRFERFYLKISNRIGQRLLREIVRSGPTPPTFTLTKLLALITAGLVHVFVVAVAAFGIFLICTWDRFWSPAGVLAVILAFQMRPHIVDMPKHNILSRQNFPTLYRLTEEV